MRAFESGSIIYAIDGSDDQEVLKCIDIYKHLPDDRKRKVIAIKIGLPYLVKNGMNVIEHIKKELPGLEVICDLKISDVPHISMKLAEIAENAGANGIVVQGFVGGETIRRLIQETQIKLSIYLVSKMSHDVCLSHKDALQLITLGAKFRVRGIIVSGFDLELISIAKQYIDLSQVPDSE